MICDDLRDSYELYALGALEPEERASIAEHLAEGCNTCERRLRRALATNAAILSMAPEAKPPKRLRRRIFAAAGGERPAWGWTAAWATVTAGLLLATLWYSTLERRRAAELLAARAESARTAAALQQTRQVLDFLNAPETRQVTFGQGPAAPPQGRILMNPSRGVLLIASNLPALEPGRAYEMWVIPKGGAPRPAGVFQPDARGNAVHVQPGPVDVPNTSAVAVSVEPEAGSLSPTTQPIIVAPAEGS
jgi:anti-sigma-K factor RskA